MTAKQDPPLPPRRRSADRRLWSKEGDYISLNLERATFIGTIITLFLIMAVLAFGVVTNSRRAEEVAALAKTATAGNRKILMVLEKEMHGHRIRNEQVHGQLVGYIKCIILLPPDQRSNEALDRCALQAFPPPVEEPDGDGGEPPDPTIRPRTTPRATPRGARTVRPSTLRPTTPHPSTTPRPTPRTTPRPTPCLILNQIPCP